MLDGKSPSETILTGDRTTGPLHLGHYVGSLRNRLQLQHTHRQFLLLADAQALTDNARDPARTARGVIEVALDYLAIGIDPTLTTICVQSCLPALPEMTILYLNYVTVARLITAFKAGLVPVGADQAPMIEQTNEIVRRINRQANRDVLVEPRALIPPVGRLPGVDGRSKMSKSQG